MTVRRGDLVTVYLDGPNDDETRGGEVFKTRPAVVIQNDVGNKHSKTTIIAPISGGLTNYPFHANLPATVDGVTKVSHVRLDQIRTVDERTHRSHARNRHGITNERHRGPDPRVPRTLTSSPR